MSRSNAMKIASICTLWNLPLVIPYAEALQADKSLYRCMLVDGFQTGVAAVQFILFRGRYTHQHSGIRTPFCTEHVHKGKKALLRLLFPCYARRSVSTKVFLCHSITEFVKYFDTLINRHYLPFH